MDRLQAMEVFVRVAELGSFSKTAEQMGLPAATVTNAIQSVEKRVGVRLLQRTTRKVTLTDDGAAYLERCQRLLAEFQDVENLFDREQPQGIVRVDLPERLAHKVVIPQLPAFFARYPDIRLKLNASDRFVDLVGEGVDCVVRVGILSDSTLIARNIGSMEQITYASKTYLDRHGRPHTLAELDKHTMINYFSSRTGRDLPWEYMQNGELKTLKLQGQVSVASSEAYMACCLAGLGIVQAPRFGVEDLLEQGVLEEVLPAFKPPPMPVSIVYSHNRHLSPRVRAFVDWLAEMLKIR
ncbi:LysR family transcriptional regulator [Herbaspirillum sp. meg3]|jgi:DNA-binding transcriptional LysR family regulator|uniref:LysR family transcriptional regulator n=1 Tax=Herbaspirillum sp. meg3 TaxID=2025949 RepID=UPI000B999193|nr:LysR family transcriptional regulator [Herbaspirillum sp. meg3]ASU39785.1 LysR family transcriptional regulator [Herbaspirillum sp. meg3]